MISAHEFLCILPHCSSRTGFRSEFQRRRNWHWFDQLGAWLIAGTALCFSLILCPGVAWAAELELNRDPILVMDLQECFVELDAEGSVIPLGHSTGSLGLRSGHSAGKIQGIALSGNRKANIETSLLDLDRAGVSIRVVVSEAAGHRVLTDATRSLKWKQEFLIVIGDSKSDGSKLALQLTPTPRRIEPIVDFPGQLLEWGARDPLYIVNRYDLRSRGAGAVAGGDPTASPDEIQALMIFDPKYGDFTLSYQQFPGSVLAGYIENERIVFQWGDDLFELISSSAPVMPKGKWSLYVKRVDHKPNGPGGVGLGAMEGPPSKFQSR